MNYNIAVKQITHVPTHYALYLCFYIKKNIIFISGKNAGIVREFRGQKLVDTLNPI